VFHRPPNRTKATSISKEQLLLSGSNDTTSPLPHIVPTNVDFSKISFTKDGLLGQGGSSKVYAASYMYLEVAVKKFESVDPATAKQLYKEVSFLRYEDHSI
jgi:hypothetical protein